MNGLQFVADIYLNGFTGSDKSFENFSHEYPLDVGPLALPIQKYKIQILNSKQSTNERLRRNDKEMWIEHTKLNVEYPTANQIHDMKQFYDF